MTLFPSQVHQFKSQPESNSTPHSVPITRPSLSSQATQTATKPSTKPVLGPPTSKELLSGTALRISPYPTPAATAFFKAIPLTFDDELCEVGDTSPAWGLRHTAVQILLCSAYGGQRESGQEAAVADMPHPGRRQQHPTLPLKRKRDGRVREPSSLAAYVSPY